MKQNILILILIFLAACKNDNSKKSSIQPSNDTTIKVTKKDSLHEQKLKKVPFVWEGNYLLNANKTEEVSCPCNCIAIDFKSTKTLCIDKKSLLTIEVNYKKLSNSKVAMYYVNGKGDSEIQKDIPWQKFDKDTPLAILTSKENKSVKLDWKGFTINHKIAVDYAIFGKKNLEGTYHKK